MTLNKWRGNRENKVEQREWGRRNIRQNRRKTKGAGEGEKKDLRELIVDRFTQNKWQKIERRIWKEIKRRVNTQTRTA